MLELLDHVRARSPLCLRIAERLGIFGNPETRESFHGCFTQVLEGKYDQSADLWSCGVIMCAQIFWALRLRWGLSLFHFLFISCQFFHIFVDGSRLSDIRSFAYFWYFLIFLVITKSNGADILLDLLVFALALGLWGDWSLPGMSYSVGIPPFGVTLTRRFCKRPVESGGIRWNPVESRAKHWTVSSRDSVVHTSIPIIVNCCALSQVSKGSFSFNPADWKNVPWRWRDRWADKMWHTKLGPGTRKAGNLVFEVTDFGKHQDSAILFLSAAIWWNFKIFFSALKPLTWAFKIMARSNKEVSMQMQALGLEPPNGSLLRRFPHVLQPPLRVGGVGGCPARRAPRRDEDTAESPSSPSASTSATAKQAEKALEWDGSVEKIRLDHQALAFSICSIGSSKCAMCRGLWGVLSEDQKVRFATSEFPAPAQRVERFPLLGSECLERGSEVAKDTATYQTG